MRLRPSSPRCSVSHTRDHVVALQTMALTFGLLLAKCGRLHSVPVQIFETHTRRLLADELEPAVAKVKEGVDKLPEAARKVGYPPLTLTVIVPVAILRVRKVEPMRLRSL